MITIAFFRLDEEGQRIGRGFLRSSRPASRRPSKTVKRLTVTARPQRSAVVGRSPSARLCSSHSAAYSASVVCSGKGSRPFPISASVQRQVRLTFPARAEAPHALAVALADCSPREIRPPIPGRSTLLDAALHCSPLPPSVVIADSYLASGGRPLPPIGLSPSQSGVRRPVVASCASADPSFALWRHVSPRLIRTDEMRWRQLLWGVEDRPRSRRRERPLPARDPGARGA